MYFVEVPIKFRDGEDNYKLYNLLKKIARDEVEGAVRALGYRPKTGLGYGCILIMSTVKAITRCNRALFDGDRLILDFGCSGLVREYLEDKDLDLNRYAVLSNDNKSIEELLDIYTNELLERDKPEPEPEPMENPMEKEYRLITREEFVEIYGRNVFISESTYLSEDFPEEEFFFKIENIESRYDGDGDIEVDKDEELSKVYKRLYLPKVFYTEVEEEKMSTKNKIIIGVSILTTIGVGYLINKFKD